MEHKIIKKEKNPFLHREEILLDVRSEINPSFSEVKKIIGGDEDLIVVKKVEGNYGSRSFNVEVYVYASKDAKDKIEKIPRKTKKKMEEANKQAQAQSAPVQSVPTKEEEKK